MYNPEVVLLIGSAKSNNYKYKTSKKMPKFFLHTFHLMASVESTIMFNSGSTLKIIFTLAAYNFGDTH